MNNNAKTISLSDLRSTDPSYLETIFSLANGHFGVRASDPIAESSTAGTLVNGFFETSDIVYGEKAYGYAKHNQTIVNLPDLRTIKIYDHDKNEFQYSKLTAEFLDMDSDLLISQYNLSTETGKTIQVTLKSAMDQKNNQIIGLFYQIKTVDYLGKIKVVKHLDPMTATSETDDPRKSRTVHTLSYDKNAFGPKTDTLKVTTQVSQMSVKMAIVSTKPLEQEFTLSSDNELSFSVIAVVGEINQELSLDNLPDFETIVRDSELFWSQFWQTSDVEISGDDSLNQAIHYNLFQLTSSTGRDGKTNIPAKGLSGTGYEGHYFWDTEMYMSPFFDYTNPEIAKNLIKYRHSILPASKARAKELGVDQGALFAWRTINGEEASAYYPAGTAQYHIDGDIAYAIYRYDKVVGDRDLIENYGLEVVLETARFWRNFGSYSDVNGEKKFCFYDVTGPDEYTAIVNNNYYTNRLAKFNLQYAVDLIKEFPDKAKQLGVTDQECQSLAEASAAVYLPFDSDLMINRQDDSSYKKPVWPFEETPKENYPLLLHYHPLTIYRYQVNKQADTLLADFLFDDITQEQLVREYDYYEKITTHDSSLSRSIFSALAARIGLKQKAYDYFMATVKTDLIDLQGNSADGLHVANLGGSWLTVVNGFGGVQVKNNLLTIDNHLPDQWSQLTVRLQFQGRLLELNYLPSATKVTVIKGEPLTIKLNGVETLVE